MTFTQLAHRWFTKGRRRRLSEEEKAARKAKAAETVRRRQEQRDAMQAEMRERARQIAVREAAEREERLRPKTLRVVNRGLIDVLVWHDHHRSRNWVAVVEVNPTARGGLDRNFFQRAAGNVAKAVVPEWLEAGHLLEFGADYISVAGKRTKTRIYAVVTDVTDRYLGVQPYDSLEEAVLR